MKKISMRLLCLCLAMALCFGLFACGEQAADPTTVPATTQATTPATTEATTPATTEATTPATTEGSTEPNYNVLTSTNPIKNIIIIIGDGMGLQHIDAGMLYDGITYPFTEWPMVRVNTYPLLDSTGAISEEPTDSAASATAMATGVLTPNGRLGNDIDNNELPTIMDLAKSMGKATGIVTTDTLSGATPGAFSGHASYRDNLNELIPSQKTSGVNLLCGFKQDKYTLIADEFKQNGYAYAETVTDAKATYSSEYALWQLDTYGLTATVPLPDATTLALEYLSQDPDGFVLMLEQAHPDKYSHGNDFEGVYKSVSDLNKTVELVMEWIGDRNDTMVIVVADHECGGLQVSTKAGKYSNEITFGDTLVSYEFRSTNHTGVNVAMYVYGVTADFTKSDLYKKKALKNIGVYLLMEEVLLQAQNAN